MSIKHTRFYGLREEVWRVETKFLQLPKNVQQDRVELLGRTLAKFGNCAQEALLKALRRSINHWVRIWIDPLRCYNSGENWGTLDCPLCQWTRIYGNPSFSLQLKDCSVCPLSALTGMECSPPIRLGQGKSALAMTVWEQWANSMLACFLGHTHRGNYESVARLLTDDQVNDSRRKALQMAATLVMIYRYCEARIRLLND